jgi:hypothetical protein
LKKLFVNKLRWEWWVYILNITPCAILNFLFLCSFPFHRRSTSLLRESAHNQDWEIQEKSVVFWMARNIGFFTSWKSTYSCDDSLINFRVCSHDDSLEWCLCAKLFKHGLKTFHLPDQPTPSSSSSSSALFFFRYSYNFSR